MIDCLKCYRLRRHNDTVYCPFLDLKECVRGEHYINIASLPFKPKQEETPPLPPKKSLKDVKPGDKIFVLNSNRGYLKEPQIEILTANKVGILYVYTDYDKYKKSNGEAVESSLDVKAFATLEEAETGLFMIKARKYYRNSIKVDDITYSQMKAIFDILGIDTEEMIK